MKKRNLLVTFVVVAFLTLIFAPMAIAVDCKGLSKGKCESNTGCSWVKSYKTKAGKTVASYCRTKPKKSKSAAAATKKKKTTTKKEKNSSKKKSTKK